MLEIFLHANKKQILSLFLQKLYIKVLGEKSVFFLNKELIICGEKISYELWWRMLDNCFGPYMINFHQLNLEQNTMPQILLLKLLSFFV